VEQEAADELVGVERHDLVACVALGPVILPFERHALGVEGDEPAMSNCDPVGVAGQVGEHRVGSAKRPLGIDHPFDLSQWGEVSFEGGRRGQPGLIGPRWTAKSPNWWIGRRTNCGLSGGNCIAPDRR